MEDILNGANGPRALQLVEEALIGVPELAPTLCQKMMEWLVLNRILGHLNKHKNATHRNVRERKMCHIFFKVSYWISHFPVVLSLSWAPNSEWNRVHSLSQTRFDACLKDAATTARLERELALKWNICLMLHDYDTKTNTDRPRKSALSTWIWLFESRLIPTWD